MGPKVILFIYLFIFVAGRKSKIVQNKGDGKVYVSPGTPASSTTKIGCHDIAEILLKVALNTINQIKKGGRV
jgi:hypothetical protein